VIPIVGPELRIIDDEPGTPTLCQYLAKELIERLSIESADLPPQPDLLEGRLDRPQFTSNGNSYFTPDVIAD
jgi:hypothetical protein